MKNSTATEMKLHAMTPGQHVTIPTEGSGTHTGTLVRFDPRGPLADPRAIFAILRHDDGEEVRLMASLDFTGWAEDAEVTEAAPTPERTTAMSHTGWAQPMLVTLTATTNPYLAPRLPLRGLLQVHEMTLTGHPQPRAMSFLEVDAEGQPVGTRVAVDDAHFTYTAMNTTATPCECLEHCPCDPAYGACLTHCEDPTVQHTTPIR